MIKFVFIVFFSIYSYSSYLLNPNKTIKTDSTVTDLVLYNNLLVISNNEGSIKIYDTKIDKYVKQINLEKITDFIGDKIKPTIYSVDIIKNKYLILSSASNSAYLNLFIYENNKLKNIISPDDKKVIIKAKFIDDKNILLAYMSNEISIFNIKNKKELYKIQLNQSKFSDFSINKKIKQAVFSCESGEYYILNLNNLSIIKKISNLNLDNVYNVDFKSNTISGAGQDRRAAIYKLDNNSSYYHQSDFLVYATALSPSANIVAFADHDDNSISIYDVNSKIKIAKLIGHKNIINKIIFKNENILYSVSGDDILIWNLKGKIK